MTALSEKQTVIYAFIRTQILEKRRPPTVREIANAHGISSTNGVRSHLAAIVRKGWITITPRVARGITLVQTDQPDFQI